MTEVSGQALTLRFAGPAGEALAGAWSYYLSDMATIVLRVRLLGGETTDLTYEDPDQDDQIQTRRHERRMWTTSPLAVKRVV